MQAVKTSGTADDHATGSSPRGERRSRRTSCLAEALRFQLDACREDERLAAIVVADELGFCVAHSGGDGVHEELAAQLPMLADPARRAPVADEAFEAALPAPVAVATFSVSGSTLHACAVGPPGDGQSSAGVGGRAALARVASGFSRMLAD